MQIVKSDCLCQSHGCSVLQSEKLVDYSAISLYNGHWKNVSTIFGKPIIVFKSQKDFKSSQDFWIPKIERNIQRDCEVTAELEKQGWIVIKFWGKDINENLSKCVDKIERFVKGEKNELQDD